MSEKFCTQCKTIKLLERFSKSRGMKDGYYNQCKDCRNSNHYEWCRRLGSPCRVCGEPVSQRSQIHQRCQTGENHPNYVEGKFTNKDGYVILTGQRHHANSTKNGTIKEHRWMMSQTLDRPLMEKENVHHKNGIRNDNRLENLELWTSSQPAGQRIEDQMKWVWEMVDLYGTMYPRSYFEEEN